MRAKIDLRVYSCRVAALFWLGWIPFAQIEGGEPRLCNIEQITSPSMGFEKAGESYFSPDGCSLIFQAVPTGERNYQIYTIDLRTRQLQRVSTGKGACTCGFYHPNGQKIIFASSHESEMSTREATKDSLRYQWEFTEFMNIYEANLDGSELRKLTSGQAYHAEASFSPDGKRIVYASNETGSMNLYVADADGSHSHMITHTQDCYNGGPFFSPQGDWIVFRADRQEKDLLQLFLIRPDGSEEHALTQNAFVNWAPYWHPGGQWIAYTTSKHGHGLYQIYLLNRETLLEERLTDTDTFEGLPSFSPDGRRLTWTSKRGDGTSQVFVADFIN